MPRSGKGHIVIHFPDVLYVFINGKDYSNYVTDWEFTDQQNEVGEFSVELVSIDAAQKVDVARGMDVQFRYANELLFKGSIEKVDYKTNLFCDITGFGATETTLKNSIVKITASTDSKSIDGRPSYGVGTTSGVSTATIIDEQISGVSTVYIGTNEYLGHITYRSDHDNVIGFLDGMARTLSGVWWTSYGSYPYTTNYFNVASRRGDGTSQKSFYTAGANQNAVRTEREIDEEELYTSVTYLGYGDGENQIKSRVYHATTNFTRLLSGCTADDTIITVNDTTGFESQTAITYEEWENGPPIDEVKWELNRGVPWDVDYAIVTSGVHSGNYSLWCTPSGNAIINKTAFPVGIAYSVWMYAVVGPSGVRVTDNLNFWLYGKKWSPRIAVFADYDYFDPSWEHGLIFYSDGTTSTQMGTNEDRVYSGNWYKFELRYGAEAKTATATVYSGVSATVLVTNTFTVIVPFTPTVMWVGGDESMGGYKNPLHIDDIVIEKYGIWAGSEYITYDGKTANTFTGCNRASSDGTVANQKYYRKYAHSSKVAVFDAAYTEYATDGNSQIDAYGLKQRVFVDKEITDQDSLDRKATEVLLAHYIPNEIISLTPVDMYDCLKTLDVGEIVTITDVDSGLDGDYTIVGQTVSHKKGAEGIEYQLDNLPVPLTKGLRDAQHRAKVDSQYMQGSTIAFNEEKTGSADSGSPLDLRIKLPSDLIRINKADLDILVTADKTVDVDAGLLSGVISRAGTAIVSGATVDLSNWIISGVDLTRGNWMLVRMEPNGACTIDAKLYIKAFIESR